jgi:hypothetical protein
MRLEDLAHRIDAMGDALANTSALVALADLGAHAFGGDAPGALGELGRALHRRFTVALTARGHEAAAHAARLAATAEAVRGVASGYRDTDTPLT